jgi:D-glycero-alpha-D-manno-heptose-7-phosphate kinase
MRISLFGGGTDFPAFYRKEGGCVLSTAINKYIYVIVKPRFDRKVRLTYTQAELVDKSCELKHDIVRECLKQVGINHGVEIITIGDLPAGTGLGSSSAVTVGVLKALYAYKGHEMGTEELAQMACRIELGALKKPIGVQDQYISAFGSFRFFSFGMEGVTNRKLSTGKLFDHLLLLYTGITRDADSILEVQDKNTTINLDTLRDIKALAIQALSEIDEGRWEGLGKLLDDSWRLKKKLALSISTPQIDAWYEKGLEAGALGGKVLGAGGGGFLLFFCPNGLKDKVRQSLSDLVEIPIRPEPDGAKIILNYRT